MEPVAATDRAGPKVREERLRTLGVRSAALLALAISLTWALTVPAFWGVDETSHVAYAVAASSGDWPTIHTPNPVQDFPGLRDRVDYDISFGRLGRLDIWTSNHPPLYFITVGIPLRLGLATGHAGAGLVVARCLTALGGAAGVFAVAWLARSVAPRRPRVEVLAAFCAALSPTLVHYAGQVFNDTLGFTLSTIGLAAGFAAIRRGITRRLFIIGAVAAGAGALTRSSGLLVAALTTAAFMLASWYGRSSSTTSLQARALATIRTAALFGGVVGLIAGGPLLVNLARYGDPTAGTALFEKFDRMPGPPWLWLMRQPRYLLDQVDRFASELSIGVWWPSVVTNIAFVVLTAGVVGGAIALFRHVTSPHPWDRRGLWIGTMCVALPVLLLAASAIFISQGGYPHSRYLLPGLGVMAAMLAVGIEGLPGSRRSLPALATLILLVGANIVLWLQFRVDHQLWYQQVFPFADLPELAPVWVGVTVGLVVGTAAVAGLVQSLLGLRDAAGRGLRDAAGLGLHDAGPAGRE